MNHLNMPSDRDYVLNGSCRLRQNSSLAWRQQQQLWQTNVNLAFNLQCIALLYNNSALSPRVNQPCFIWCLSSSQQQQFYQFTDILWHAGIQVLHINGIYKRFTYLLTYLYSVIAWRPLIRSTVLQFRQVLKRFVGLVQIFIQWSYASLYILIFYFVVSRSAHECARHHACLNDSRTLHWQVHEGRRLWWAYLAARDRLV